MQKNYLNIIDHTLLKQDATLSDIKACCDEAIEYSFYSVITQPYYVKYVRQILNNSGVLCGTVIGFPFGNEAEGIKRCQAQKAVDSGAQEIDMVICMAALKNKNYSVAVKDIEQVTRLGVPVKVIIETSLLDRQEIIKACRICIEGGAAYVKTSTGYFGGGATAENIKLIKEVTADKIKIKASGGIKTLNDVITLTECGADRIGTSSGVNIAKQLLSRQGKY